MFVFSQIARVDPAALAISMRQSFTEHIQSQHHGLLIQNLIFHSAVTPWDFLSQFASRGELETNLYLCQWYLTTNS